MNCLGPSLYLLLAHVYLPPLGVLLIALDLLRRLLVRAVGWRWLGKPGRSWPTVLGLLLLGLGVAFSLATGIPLFYPLFR